MVTISINEAARTILLDLYFPKNQRKFFTKLSEENLDEILLNFNKKEEVLREKLNQFFLLRESIFDATDLKVD